MTDTHNGLKKEDFFSFVVVVVGGGGVTSSYICAIKFKTNSSALTID